MYVYRPFAAQTSNMLLRAKRGVAAACLLGVSMAVIDRYIAFKVVSRQTETGEHYFKWIQNALDFDLIYNVNLIVCVILLKFVLPILIIAPLTVITIFLLLRQNRERRSLQRGAMTGRSDFAMTVTLVGIVVAFICLRGPNMFLAVAYFSRRSIANEVWFNTLYYITISIAMLNPISNFIIYFVTGRQFRRSLRRMFVCTHERGFESSSAKPV